MALLVKNERASDFVFATGKDKPQTLAAGATAYLSEAEWYTVPFGLRGPGGLVVVEDQNQVNDTVDEQLLEYYTTSGAVELRYLGTAPQGSATSAGVWTIQQFSHFQAADSSVRIVKVETLREVAWDNRATLPW